MGRLSSEKGRGGRKVERKGQQQGPLETKAAVRLVWPYFLSDDTLKAVGHSYVVYSG